MKIKKISLLVIYLLFAGVSAISAVKPASESAAVDVGNKFCPVSGDKVSGKHFAVYEGKRYSLCCPMCEEKFLKNPHKYMAKIAQKENL